MAVVGAGIVALGTLAAAWYSSEQAKKLDSETTSKVNDALNTLINNYKKPVFDRTPLTREQYQVLGTYAPTIAGFVQEKSPEMVREAASTQEKELQKSALQQYQQLSVQGEDAQAIAQRESGLAAAQGQQNRNTQQLLQSYQNQGVGNGGQALSAALQTGQAADQQRRQLALDVASQNEQRRTQALGQMATLAGQVRGQNANVEEANVNAINQFNQRNAQNLNSYNQYVAKTQSEAQAANLQNQQNVANSNIQGNNALAEYNKNMLNQMNQQEAAAYNNQNQAVANAKLGMATNAQQVGEANINRNTGLMSSAFQGIGNVYGASKQPKYSNTGNENNVTTTSTETGNVDDNGNYTSTSE